MHRKPDLFKPDVFKPDVFKHALFLSISLSTLVAISSAASAADAPTAAVQREVVGTRTSENIPAIPAELLDQLNRYQNTRGAGVAGWTKDGCLLISTRFAETAQAHRVCEPMGMREQLTFYPEPVNGLTTAVGFGSMMLADHRGIYGLGLLLTLGTVASLVAALVVLPVLLQLMRPRRPAPTPTRRPGWDSTTETRPAVRRR